MNENTRRLSQSFTERNDEAYVRDIVSHTPEATQEFADLTARLVELEEQPYLTIHRPAEQSLVRARIWSVHPNVYGHGCDGHPDRGSQQDIFVAEVFLRPFGERYGRIHSPDGLLRALTERGINTGEGRTLQTDGGYCREVQFYSLSVNPRERSEMSTIARTVTEALQNGIPLGETEPRSPRMGFVRYHAGQGRVGIVADRGYLLTKGNDVYVVNSDGEFIMDENNQITRALGVPEQTCFGCSHKMNFHLARDLETTLAGQDLAGKRVFFVGNCGDDGNDVPEAVDMLKDRKANVYAFYKDAEGLL